MTLVVGQKNWDKYVFHAEEVARSVGFRQLRDAIIERAELRPHDRVLDVGAGTGLLTLAAAPVAAQVWALDISDRMCDYLATKVLSAGLDNVETVVGSAVSLPLVDESVDVAVSNYCLHHLAHRDKLRALEEIHRVLVPGGRLVVGDMMFSVALRNGRSRAIINSKVKALLRRGPAGVWRLVKNGGRFATRRWEQPAPPEWWHGALVEIGFSNVGIEPRAHEGGIAWARKP